MSDELARIPIERIVGKIYEIRGERVLLDSDLADIYDVTTKRLNEQVKRMLERGGLLAAIGPEHLYWSADQAIVAAEQLDCRYCAAEAL